MPGKKFSHGRGGAGNISLDDIEYVDGLNYSPPILSVLYRIYNKDLS